MSICSLLAATWSSNCFSIFPFSVETPLSCSSSFSFSSLAAFSWLVKCSFSCCSWIWASDALPLIVLLSCLKCCKLQNTNSLLAKPKNVYVYVLFRLCNILAKYCSHTQYYFSIFWIPQYYKVFWYIFLGTSTATANGIKVTTATFFHALPCKS